MKNPKSVYVDDLEHLRAEMAALALRLDELPDDVEWTPDSLAALEDVRHATLKLTCAIEAVLEEFEGR